MKRSLTPLLALAVLSLVPSMAHAKVLCVGTSGGDCYSEYATTQEAIDAAVDGSDTIRFGEGTFDSVSTLKILSYVGAGAGTPQSAAGATVLRPGDPPAVHGMALWNGGSVTDLRAVGRDGGEVAGAGIEASSFGTSELDLTDVIAIGGQAMGDTGFGYGGFPGKGLSATEGDVQIDVTRGHVIAGPRVEDSSYGKAVELADSSVRATFIGTQITDPAAEFGTGVRSYNGAEVTLDGSDIDAATGILATGGPVYVRRSRIDATERAVHAWADDSDPVDVDVRNSLLLVEGGASAPALVAQSDSFSPAAPVAVGLVGSTVVAKGSARQAAVLAIRPAGAAASAISLRSTVARRVGSSAPGADLVTEGGQIAANFSAFTTAESTGGSIPVPTGTNVSGDPKLAADFKLLPGSPLIDRGDGDAVLIDDLDFTGAARSLDGNGDGQSLPDIGAYERAAPAPPAGGARPPAAKPKPKPVTTVNLAPALSRFKLGKKNFSFSLSEAARVTIVIERKKGKRWKKVKTIRGSFAKGGRKASFKAKRLKAGRYRARIAATDSTGKRSAEKRLSFRVAKRKR